MLKSFIRKSLCLLAFLVALWVLFLLFLQTEKGQQIALKSILNRIKNSVQLEIEIKKVSLSFPLKLKLEEVTLKKEGLKLAEIDGVYLECRPGALLQGRIIFSEAVVKTATLFEAAASLQKKNPTSPSLFFSNWEAPFAPLYIKFEKIQVEALCFSEPLLERLNFPSAAATLLSTSYFSIDGSLSSNPFKSSVTTYLLLKGIKSPLKQFKENLKGEDPSFFSLSFDLRAHYLSLSFHSEDLSAFWEQSENSFAIKNQTAFYLSGNTQSWQEWLKGHTTKEAITGHFKGSYHAPSLISHLSPSMGGEISLKTRLELREKNSFWLESLELSILKNILKGHGVIEPTLLEMHLSFFDEASFFSTKTDLKFKAEKKELAAKFSIESQENRLHGNLSLHFPLLVPTGSLNCDFSDLRSLGLLFNKQLQGSAALQVELQIEKGDEETDHFICYADGSLHAWKSESVQAEEIKGVCKATLHDLHSLFENSPLPVEGSFKAKNLMWEGFLLEEGSSDFSSLIEPKTLNIKSINCKGENRNFSISREKTSPLFVVDEMNYSWQFDEETQETIFQCRGQSLPPLSIDLSPIQKSSLNFELQGSHSLKNSKTTLSYLTGSFLSTDFELTTPLFIEKSHEKTTLNPIAIRLGEKGEIEASFSLEKEIFSLNFTASSLSSALIRPFYPETAVEGVISVKGAVGGPLESPSGKLIMTLDKLEFSQEFFEKKIETRGSILFDLSPNKVELSGELNNLGDKPWYLSGFLPLHFNLKSPTLAWNVGEPFRLAIAANGELSPLAALFSNVKAELGGIFTLDVQLFGNLDAPQVQGIASITDGSYESLTTGTVYHNVQVDLEGDGSKIVLKKLSAQDNKQGVIEAQGEIAIDVAQGFPYILEIRPSHIFLLDSDYIDISASGQLYLKGNIKESKLEGELSIDSADVHLEETLPKNIKTIEVQYDNLAENDPLLEHLKKREKDFPLELNVKLTNSGNITIEGKQVTSTWKGSLTATGKPASLQLNGDLTLIKGEYRLNGKAFTLTQGSIHFGGSIEKKTSLYIVATKEINAITTEIIMKGSVNKPVISFRSTPPLSQREILSYILFNRGISDISKEQGDQLSQSFIALNSQDQLPEGDSFLTKLKNSFKLDTLDFTAGNNGDSQGFGLQIGKQLTENIMLSISENSATLMPYFSVEAKLHKNIKVQAEGGVGENAPIRTSIKWKKDY